MQTINVHELNPRLILEKYEKYDIGRTPYAIMNEDGEAKAVPVQVFDALEKNTQSETENEIRKAVMRMTKENNTEQIQRITKEMYDYLLKTEETENTPWNDRVTWVFDSNKLRFLRFLLDLPKEDAHEFMERLVVQKDETEKERNFTELLGVRTNELNPLYDVVMKHFHYID